MNDFFKGSIKLFLFIPRKKGRELEKWNDNVLFFKWEWIRECVKSEKKERKRKGNKENNGGKRKEEWEKKRRWKRRRKKKIKEKESRLKRNCLRYKNKFLYPKQLFKIVSHLNIFFLFFIFFSNYFHM